MEWNANSEDRVDAVVIGAGVVGLAVARALSLSGREVIVMEAEKIIGSATSSRNSEVIHAGIYYPPKSLKAQLCVEGKSALYDYCRERGIGHAQPGKLLVASDEDQIAKLHQISENAIGAGVTDLVMLSRAEAKELEPELKCHAALLSPSTGIVDVHELMLSYQGDLENTGGMLILGATVVAGKVTDRGVSLLIDQNGQSVLSCRTVVNCAGLSAQKVASSIEGYAAKAIPRQYLAKGNYFKLAPRPPFKHLVYPMPSNGGLGIHLTLDLAGRARFGPDVQWVEDIDYRVDETRLPLFEDAIRTYWPGLPSNALAPDYSGVRPKLHGQGTPAADFMIQSGEEYGAPGLINLFGIESPGITASLAIANYACRLANCNDRQHISTPAASPSGVQAEGDT
ncbi:NAD(P)/FAD-dependent oxidoreductase [Rhizobium sp. KVB221]|uniref:NAD(P)/FAD-dependent oxidoreductase n=1 Tax=Rhizobium setariae TaxID=2801340 RepID=A0A936YUY7_9HYPH|nr:NAD(P)/FAD-dependent oxidoreductase [Rhizobium setariae]MBL0373557.1 NAD(P)/FAD-dependent oxidoreductase [Rhizobium setariae]